MRRSTTRRAIVLLTASAAMGAASAPAAGAATAGPAVLLTGPSGAPPQAIVLGYLRTHLEDHGLRSGDLDHLRLVARSTSPDGITHLRYDQVLDGVESYDRGVSAHVTRDGRLVTVTGRGLPGAALPSTTPRLTASAGLARARTATRGSGLAPRVASSGPGRATFATGETARLRWTARGGEARLAWSVVADGRQESSFAVLVDAATGDMLERTPLTAHAGQARHFPLSPDVSPATTAAMPAAWYDDNASGTRLWGDFARTYLDPADEDPAAGSEQGGARVQIPQSGVTDGGPDWLYSLSHTFPGAAPCPPSGCTWDSAAPSTASVNAFEAATNAHVLVSRFHDHLAAPPIGFDEASGNFQRDDPGSAGVAGDYVRVEVNDGQGLNNANMSTPPDGEPPRMQMFLFDRQDVNGADTADIVYHEYGHGLSNRLVVNASGVSTLTSLQGRMMGEGWSDFYALDLLNEEGSLPDTPAPGEVTTGRYVTGGDGARRKPIDCPVDPAGTTAPCNGNGSGPEVLGGYTYGDLARTDNTTPHNGSEPWAQALWDLRARVGSPAALALVTGGMRLSPDDPTMLDMRDAIVAQAVAMRSAPGAADDFYRAVWETFAARGFGASATTTGGDDATPVEAFDVPTGLRAGAATVTDPYPGGDHDGILEAGEVVAVSQPVTGVGFADLSGVTGALTSATAGAEILDGTAGWPLLGGGRTAVNGDALRARLPATCTSPTLLDVAVTSPAGGATRSVAVDPRPGSRTAVAILDEATATSTYRVYGAGTVTDVDLRIDELRHSYLGDVEITLTHDGVTRTVVDPQDDWDADDIVDAVLDDEAADPFPTTGAGPVTGRVRPTTAGALAAFDGHPVAGDWTLAVHDQASPDRGELRRWGVEGPQVGCSPLEIPTAQTLPAGDVAATTATLHGTVAPNGRATGLRFAYGATAAYGQATAVQDVGDGPSAVAGTAALAGLEPGTTYHARAEAIREDGEVAVVGDDLTFTTAPAPAVAPAPPTVTQPPPPPRDRTAPRFTRRPGIGLGAKRRGARTATATFALSERARVAVALQRRAAGVRVGRRCLAPRPRRHGRRCERLVGMGHGVRRTLPATGRLRLAIGRLRAGRYVATLTATDAAGNRSRRVTVTFRVR